jgi:MoxR-like ATPase
MSQSFTYTGTSDYIAAPDLMQTVNVAVQLSRPLLIKGEPGTGKTMLAQSIARGLDMPLIIWNVKSTTKAQDGLYVYDTVQRLYDGQFGDSDVSDIARYIKPGKLGEAFRSEERVVLLIDEIDKADLEFPNDLLWELDQMEFNIPETHETVRAVHRPIMLITSNAEKELPDAFLRRCVFHYIEFPDEEMMERIVHVHVPQLDKRLLDLALQAFYWLRQVPGLQKKPSTSELIDWVQALARGGVDPQEIAARLPFMGVLLKKDHDQPGALERPAAVARPAARPPATPEATCSPTSSFCCASTACPSRSRSGWR